MKPICIYGQRPAPNSPYHVYMNTPKGYNDGIYLAPHKELNRLSTVRGNKIVHKKYKTLMEAELFCLSLLPENFCLVNRKKKKLDVAVAYTDGSYSPSEDKFSYGAYISHGDDEYEICGKLSCPDNKYRNIAGEVEAVKQALSFCKSRNINAVEVRYDFEQLKSWADNGGKNELAEAFHEFVEGIRKAGMQIAFEKVKAHSGNIHNVKADRLSRALWSRA